MEKKVNTPEENTPVQENDAQPIINKEAAKAKASQVANGAMNTANGFVNKLKSDRKTLYTTIGVVAALIVIILLITVIMPGPAKVVKGYCKAFQNFNAEKIVKYIHPNVIEEMEEYLDDDVVDTYQDEFDNYKDNDFKVRSFEIDKDYDEYDKDEVEEYAETLDNLYDIDEKKVKAIREYEVKFKFEEDGDKSTEKVDILVVKIGSKWYVFSDIV